jgi:nucleoside-diphosphate-sugar epimerase
MSSIKKPIDIVKQDVLNIFEMHSRLPDPLRNSHIYITGGTGFLGTWLLELICGLNDEFDFKIRATIASRSMKKFAANFPHLVKRKEFVFQATDVRNLAELPHDTTHIIHAAATSNRDHFASFPTLSFENNINATLQIFRLAMQLGAIQNVVLVSSSLVYGRQPNDAHPLKEDSFGGVLPSLDSNSIYAESKRACESAAAAFLTEMKLPISVARPFSLVGPYQSLDLPWAVTDFMQEALKGGPIKIMSDGSVVRSVMYASDFANWILHITAYAKPRAVYNVGSPEPIDLLSLAKMIRSYFKDEPQILTSLGNNTSSGDRRVVPNVDKAKKELQLKITVNLEQAIQRVMDWHTMGHYRNV